MISLDYYKSEGIKARKRGYKRLDCDYERLTYEEADWWKAGWDQEDARQKSIQVHPLNCGTCKYATKLILDASKCPVGDPYPLIYACSKQNECWMPDKCWTWVVGCASHSDSKFVED